MPSVVPEPYINNKGTPYISLMTKKIPYLVLVAGIVTMILVAGCVTPPKSSSASSGSGSYYTTPPTPVETPTTPSFVQAATPFTTSTPEEVQTTAIANPYATPTPNPADLSCLIYENTSYFTFTNNTNAISFDLKNPPMYINYTVIPFNVTVTKYLPESGQGSNQPITLQYSDFAPYSWYEITVRDSTTGAIYLDNGFGPYKSSHPLSVYTTATLGPILNSGNLHIEMTGQNITATVGIWVKPEGNIDDPQNQTFPECRFWGSQPQNYLVYATTTPTPTWTAVNVQTPNNPM